MSESPITSDLSQPGAQAPSAPPPTQAPAPGPHGRLMAMIQGLAVGVGAFAHSAATQGREGGPADVQAFQSEQQKQQLREQESKQSAQTAQRENQEGDLRIKAMQAQMVMNAASFHHAVQMWPTEDKNKMLELSNNADKAYTNAWGEGYDLADPKQAADWHAMQQNVINIPFSSGQSPQEVLSAASDAATKNGKSIIDYTPFVDYKDAKHETGGTLSLAPTSELAKVDATPRQISGDMALMKGMLEKSTAAFGKDDPDVKKLTGQLDTWQGILDKGGVPSAKDHRLVTLGNIAGLATRIGMHSQTLKLQQESSEAAKAASDATRSAQEADPAFQVKQAGAKKGAEAAAELPFAGKKAAAEAAATQPYKIALANTEAPIRAGVQNDEKARTEAETYTKGYVEKMSQVSELKNAVGEAANGNVAAAKIALIKLTGLSMPSGSKRLSPEAMYQLEHMGSDAQKWVGSIKNALTGDSWTSGMSKDVLDFADNQAAKARQQLSMGVHTLNAVRGTKIDPNAIFQAANQDQDWSQQVDSPADSQNPSGGTPPSTGGSLADKWKKKLSK